jgi:hypothetical protein
VAGQGKTGTASSKPPLYLIQGPEDPKLVSHYYATIPTKVTLITTPSEFAFLEMALVIPSRRETPSISASAMLPPIPENKIVKKNQSGNEK